MDEQRGDAEQFEYVGFWARVGASLIDTVLACLVVAPLISMLTPSDSFLLYGGDWSDIESLSLTHTGGLRSFLLSYVLPAAIVVVFWLTRQATPGKMAIGARVVDAATGAKLSTGQAIGRYLGYFVSTIPFCLGLIWVGFDSRKQGWHDKLAGTVVIRAKKRGVEPVRFDGKP